MDYEKKYKESIERMKSWMRGEHPECFSEAKKAAEFIFPELKESEDEKTRKSLILLLQHFCKGYRIPGLNFPVSYKDMLAWLEKQGEKKSVDDLTQQEAMDIAVAKCFEQGEQKVPVADFKAKDWYVSKVDGKIHNIHQSVDKVEPKFKVGDWIIHQGTDKVFKIAECDLGIYTLIDTDGYKTVHSIINVDRNTRLWKIEDAKPGNILVDYDNRPFIFKGLLDITHPSHPVAYCGINTEDEFRVSVLYNNHWTFDKVYPATKEQRNFLFQKMKETGYEWDAKKKELNKIEQKPSWSEEDSPYYDDICEILINLLHSETTKVNKDVIQKDLNWLVSIQNRVIPQPKQEWSENDERIYQSIMDDTVQENQLDRKQIDWLKLLKERYTWKPSNEQLDALHDAAVYVDKSMFPYPKGILMKLYKQLKKLKGE